ncbi:MAG: cupin domain-containing protein [Pseudomonadales bacterium]|nr:cupin domain-containing protein [Pseudomonadales bacterium]
MTEDARTPPLLTSQEISRLAETVNVHQFNENAVRHTKSLSDRLGLTQIGVHLVRVEKGHDSTQFHFHHVDEEFIYVLSGRGIAEIGSERIEVGPGDFMGFAQHSVPHNLHNPFDEDLVYLMGGNRSPIDVCDYPKINRRMYRVDGNKEYVDFENLKAVPKSR